MQAMGRMCLGVLTPLLLVTQVPNRQPKPTPGGGPPPATLGFYFLEFGGTFSGYFATCTGLGSESRADKDEGLKFKPRVTFPDLTCTRGLTNNQDLWIWRKQVEQGEGARKDGMVTIFDAAFAPVAQWQVSQAWPRKLALGESFTEQVSLQYDEVTRVK